MKNTLKGTLGRTNLEGGLLPKAKVHISLKVWFQLIGWWRPVGCLSLELIFSQTSRKQTSQVQVSSGCEMSMPCPY